MNKLYFKPSHFPDNPYDFGFITNITIEGVMISFNSEVKLLIDTFLNYGKNVILEDGKYSCTSIKEIYPDIELLTTYPKNYVRIIVKSNPAPG